MAGQQRVISSTFNVNTVDETVSLQAQYAPNPTASQIHNTWQNGDLYMRTKMTNETTWSDWHKIVGEKGGETDYSFAISSQLSSTSSSTPPLDCESESSWHDTPQAVTPLLPYLWMRIKKKVWNESTQQYDVVSTSYARLSAESNYIADLDNEMDSIECNNLGYPKSVQTVTTKATLYRGSTLLSSTIAVYDDDTSGAQYTNGTPKVGITISWNDTTGVINVAFATSTIRTEKEVFCIKLTATDSGQPIVRLLYLTVNCVRGTALYRLVPSTDTITRRKNNTRVPSGNITCDVQKIVNGVISTPAASEYSLKMKVDDGLEEDYDTVAVSTITSSIEYILRVPQTSGTIVDRERVPLLIDGNDGLNAFVVDLENEMTNVALTEDGNTLTAVDFYFKVQAFYGTTNVLSDSDCTVSASCSDNNVVLDTTYAKTSTGIHVQVEQNVALANSTNITVTVAHTTYGTRTVVFTLAGVRGGKDAVLQELLPSLDNITFSRLANGGLSPSSRNLDISIKKTQGGVTTIQSISSSNLIIRWSTVSMPETQSGGSSWSQGSATGITWSIITMQIANTVEASNIYIAAFNSNGTLVDRETIPIIKDGQHGESSWLADLDNEMDSVSCDDIGHPVSEQTVSTRISLYLGRTPKVFKITAITRNGSFNMGIGVTVDPVVSLTTERSTPTTFAVTYATTATISGKDDFAITIVAVDDDTVTRTLHFTVNGIKGDVYNLSPSTGDMVFSVDANGAYQPSAGYNVSCKVRRRGVNGGITDITTGLNNIDGKGMTLFFRWLNADGNQSDESGDTSGSRGTHWYIGYKSTSPYGMKTSLVPPTTPLSAMEWCISTAANGDSVTDASIIDREVIPIIKSGKKGDDAPVAFADPEKITIQCDQNGNVKAQVSTNVTFSLKVGSHNVTPSSVSCDSHPTNVTIGNGYTDYIKSITVPTSQTASGIASGCTFTVTGTYDNKQFSAKVTVALIGSTQGETGGTGQRGKTGRFYYYAQEWSDSTSVSYLVSDAQAPYFKYGYNYYVFNPEENGDYTMHDMGEPSPSSANWELMTTDFKYIITEAIFGNYAHFGSFIIFGDWQLSTNGEIDGTPYNNSANIGGTVITSDGTSSFSIKGYTLFDPSYPLGDTIVVTSGGSTDKVVISNQENTKTIATVYLVSNCVYKFKCKGRRYSDSYSVLVRLRSISGSNGTWVPVYYPTSDYESQTFTFRPQTSGYFYLEMYQPSLPSSYDVTAGGETSYWLLTRVTFRPILAFDGMTGKTYQSDAHMRGVITSEDVLNGNKIVIDAPNGGMRMTGPVRVDEQTHRPNGDARENLIEMLFETDPDTNTRIGTFYVRDGRKKMETQVDPEYGVRCSNKILSDERVAELRYDGMSIKEGSESTYREVSTDPVGFGLVVGDGSSQKKLLINEEGVSIRIGTTTHTKTWAQILGF